MKYDVYNNILRDMQELCKAYRRLRLISESSDDLCGSQLDEVINEIINTRPNWDECASKFTNTFAAKLSKLWNDKEFQCVYNKVKTYQHMDNTHHFVTKIEEICNDKYSPSIQDCMFVRKETRGIEENKFLYLNQYEINVLQFGGIRANRRKWAYIYKNDAFKIDWMVWMIVLGEYDQFLHEDCTVNRWDDSFKTFERVINNPQFKCQKIMVILNKYDLYLQKLNKIPFSMYKKDWKKEYDHDDDKVLEYVKQKFVKMNQECKIKRCIQFLVMSATDMMRTSLIQTVIDGYCRENCPDDIIQMISTYHSVPSRIPNIWNMLVT